MNDSIQRRNAPPFGGAKRQGGDADDGERVMEFLFFLIIILSLWQAYNFGSYWTQKRCGKENAATAELASQWQGIAKRFEDTAITWQATANEFQAIAARNQQSAIDAQAVAREWQEIAQRNEQNTKDVQIVAEDALRVATENGRQRDEALALARQLSLR